MPKKKKHPKRHRPKPRNAPVQSTAIVPAAPVTAIVAAQSHVSMIPKIKETVQNLERVRRFVSVCLNTDLQKWEAKNPHPGPQANRDALQSWEDKRKSLEVDWGTIPGNDKPFLMQPGAEKILFWLQLAPKFVNREIDLGEGHIEMISKVIVYHKKTHEEVFEGPECSCSTMETNYRYIWADSDRNPPDEEKDRLKMMGMGRNRLKKEWKRGKMVGERWVWQVRIDNPNIYNERNKVRQIGQKRALVKVVRNMGALSEIFTQPPDEWDINPEDTDGSPETDLDYTPGGRRVVIDGKSPSGTYTTRERQQRDAHETSQAIADAKNKGIWCERHQCPYPQCPADEHSDGEMEAMEAAERAAKAQPVEAQVMPKGQGNGQDARNVTPKPSQATPAPIAPQRAPVSQQPTHKPPTTVPDAELGGIWPKRPKKDSGKQEDAPEAQKASKGPVARQAPAGPTLLCGTLHNAVIGQARNQAPYVNAKINGAWYYCWSTHLHEFLLNKRYPLVVEVWLDKRNQIVGLKRMGTVNFDEDGRTPIVENSTREAGQKTLYG
jgi:hypothetical protein